MRKLIPVFACALSIILAIGAQAFQFRSTILPRYYYGDSHYGPSVAHAINNRGDIVGDAAVNYVTQYGGSGNYRVTHAVMWSNNTVKDLGALQPYAQSHARDVNDAGIVVGESQCYYGGSGQSSPGHAFVLQDGYMQDLNPSPEWGVSYATAINNLRQIVGCDVGTNLMYDNTVDRFNMWGTGTFSLRTPVNLPLGSIINSCYAYGINDNSQVVGSCITNSNRFACIWDSNGGRLLQGLSEDASSIARSINEAGQIVGRSGNHACLWTDDIAIALDTDICSSSEAYAINRRGQVVGSYVIDMQEHAFYWDATNGMIDLGVGKAYDINDDGQIVGELSGEAALWTPVPEPSCILTLICAIGGFGGMICRRRS